MTNQREFKQIQFPDYPGSAWVAGTTPAAAAPCVPDTAGPAKIKTREPEAQELFDEQMKTDWPKLLAGVAEELNPLHEEIFRGARNFCGGSTRGWCDRRCWVWEAET